MSELLKPLLTGWALAAIAMSVVWGWQRRTGNAGVVDLAWVVLTGTLGSYFAACSGGLTWLRWLAGTMISAWAARLAMYLAARLWGRPEEGRYQTLRKQWGAAAERKFFGFFQMQAAAAVAFAAPVLAIGQSTQPPAKWLVATALVLWTLGVGGTALADWQLARFKRSGTAPGRTCRAGLWRYSRHPNYFFEWLHWCAYIPLAAASPYWWLPVAVAAALLYLVLFVTGIPPTEAQAVLSRGEDYRDYQRTTSPFIPWPPKN